MNDHIRMEVIHTNYAPGLASAKFTLVVTVKNEAKNIVRFLGSIARQTRQPDDFIIVDGGSTDGTVALIKNLDGAFEGTTKPCVYVEDGASPARGRNIGIKTSHYDLIVTLDAGCEAPPNTLTDLVGPMSNGNPPDLTGGIYCARQPSKWTHYFIPNWEDSGVYLSFLPSARCLAFWRSKAAQIGMFPDHLQQRWGEDTLFDIRYREISKHWVINKAACVVWDAPTTEQQAIELAEHYGWGNGETGAADIRWSRAMAAGTHFADPVIEASYRGYLHGRSLRLKAQQAGK